MLARESMHQVCVLKFFERPHFKGIMQKVLPNITPLAASECIYTGHPCLHTDIYLHASKTQAPTPTQSTFKIFSKVDCDHTVINLFKCVDYFSNW